MTALAAVTVSRDDVLAVCRAAVDDKAQLSADTAASVAALIARCAGPARDQFRDQPGLQLILAMIGVVRERITELANANPSAAFDQHQAELAELAARTISWGRLGLTPAAETRAIDQCPKHAQPGRRTALSRDVPAHFTFGHQERPMGVG